MRALVFMEATAMAAMMPDKPTTFKARRRPAQHRGGSATARDTSRAFRALCARLRAREPLCRYCYNRGHITRAAVTDHIVALSLGGDDREANLCPACGECNSAKAIVEQRFAASGYSMADIMLDPELSEWIKLASSKPS